MSSADAGGTIFTLTTGVYMVDYEISLGSAGSIALYTGADGASLVIDTNTIAGSSTATTWIHGRSIVDVPDTLVIALSSVTGTAAVVTAGNAAGVYMVRLTIIQLSL